MTEAQTSHSAGASQGFSFPFGSHHEDIEEDLIQLESKINRYDEMRQIAQDAQQLQNKKIFDDAMARKNRINEISKTQTRLGYIGLGTTALIGFLAAIEVVTAGLAGIKWSWRTIRRAREKNARYEDSSSEPSQRLHARDWKPQE
jgi:hypothetical protein